MSVFRKESGSLVKKAGRAIVDLALSLTSNNAVANSVVTRELNQKVTKFSGTDSGNTYVTVDQLAYDATNKKLGLKVNGADTVIPFSSGVTLTDWSFDVYIQGHSADARYGTWGLSTFSIPNLGWKTVKITHISSLRGTPTTTPSLGVLTDISNKSKIDFSFQSYTSANSDNYSTVRVELKV